MDKKPQEIVVENAPSLLYLRLQYLKMLFILKINAQAVTKVAKSVNK